MTVRHIRLALGLFFLVAGVAILGLRFGAPDFAAVWINNNPMQLVVGALLALVLGGLNVAKWYAGWLASESAATPVRRPLRPDPTARGESELNPEFDFTRESEPDRK